MEAFLVSIGTIAVAEMGDRTQLLSLVLSTHFRKPWPIIAGILVATLANHAAAGYIGERFGQYLTPTLLNAVVGASMVAMTLWTLKPDKLDDKVAVGSRGAFFATLVAFFIAEIGDKTQIATVALAAGYASLGMVVAGTTCGMLAANIPVVLLGKTFAEKLPMRAIHYGASVLFLALGIIFIGRAALGP